MIFVPHLLIDRLGCCILELGEHVAVDVGGSCDAGVAQALESSQASRVASTIIAHASFAIRGPYPNISTGAEGIGGPNKEPPALCRGPGGTEGVWGGVATHLRSTMEPII